MMLSASRSEVFWGLVTAHERTELTEASADLLHKSLLNVCDKAG